MRGVERVRPLDDADGLSGVLAVEGLAAVVAPVVPAGVLVVAVVLPAVVLGLSAVDVLSVGLVVLPVVLPVPLGALWPGLVEAAETYTLWYVHSSHHQSQCYAAAWRLATRTRVAPPAEGRS